MPNTTQNYNLKKPLKNEFVDVNILNENMNILDLNLKSVSEKTNTAVQSVKIGNTEYKNGTEVILPNYPSTPAEVGLGNVPNVSTNNQTPTYTEASSLSRLSSGEKLSTAFGKISKAITDLISHLSDSVKHITSTERTNWNNAYTHSTSAHAPSNAEVNQNAFSKIKVGSTVLSSDSKSGTFELLAGNNVTLTPNKSGNKITISSSSSSGGSSYTLPVATSSALGGIKSGTDITVDSDGNVSVNDNSHNHTIDNIANLQSSLNGKLPIGTSNDTYTTLADFWTYCNGVFRTTACNTMVVKCKLSTFVPIDNWYRCIVSAQNLIGNGSYAVRGSIILDGDGDIYYGRVSGGKTDASDLSVQWSVIGGNNYCGAVAYTSTEPTVFTKGLIWIK